MKKMKPGEPFNEAAHQDLSEGFVFLYCGLLVID